MGSMLFISLVAYGSTHDTSGIKDRVDKLRTLWSTQATSPEEDLKNFGGETQSKILKELHNGWNAKRNDLGSRVITPLLKDLKAAGVKKDTLPLLEKKMIALFKKHFTSKDSEGGNDEGGNQALNLVIYEYLKDKSNIEELNTILDHPTKKWAEVLNPKGFIVTYWQLFLVEKLEEDSDLIAIKDAFSKLKKSYAKLYKTLELANIPDTESIVTEFLKDSLWQRYEIEIKQSSDQVGSLWAISNDGKLYYTEYSDDLEEGYLVPRNLRCINVLTNQPISVTNLPLKFKTIGNTCLIMNTSNEIFKIDLETSEAVPLHFTIPKNRFFDKFQVLKRTISYEGNVFLEPDPSRKTEQIILGNSKNQLHPLSTSSGEPINDAIVCADGNVVLGFAKKPNGKIGLSWFNGFSGKLIYEEQEHKKLNDKMYYFSTLSDDGSMIAFYDQEKTIIIENSPIAKERIAPKVLNNLKSNNIRLYNNGKILGISSGIHLVNSTITLSYPQFSTGGKETIASSKGEWFAFIRLTKNPMHYSPFPSPKNDTICLWKISPGAADQIKKQFDIAGSEDPSLTEQERLDLLGLYKNREFVTMPEKWVKFAEKITKGAQA